MFLAKSIIKNLLKSLENKYLGRNAFFRYNRSSDFSTRRKDGGFVDKKTLLNLAAANKLNLTVEEEKQLDEYMDFALLALDKMQEVATENVQPLIHCVDFTNVFRQDEVAKTVSRDELLANAPQESEGCFKVPMVVE